MIVCRRRDETAAHGHRICFVSFTPLNDGAKKIYHTDSRRTRFVYFSDFTRAETDTTRTGCRHRETGEVGLTFQAAAAMRSVLRNTVRRTRVVDGTRRL